MAGLGQFLHVPWNFEFSMIGLGQEVEIEEITLRPEIWWHDTVYHEADHCIKWPHFANVHIFWFLLAEGAVVIWTSCLQLLLQHLLVNRPLPNFSFDRGGHNLSCDWLLMQQECLTWEFWHLGIIPWGVVTKHTWAGYPFPPEWTEGLKMATLNISLPP